MAGIAASALDASSFAAMELLDEESHRVLLWAVRLHEVGHVPTPAELRALAEQRRPAGLAVVRGLSGQDPVFEEDATASLLRRGLLGVIGVDGVAPSELGRRVVDVLGLDARFPAFEVLDVDLSSSDPLAFARIVGRIAVLHHPMVVDPYCRRSELEYLCAHTSVTRVLVSDRLDEDEIDDLVDHVTSLRHRDHKLRLRVAPAEVLKDRCVVSAERILQVGGLPSSTSGGSSVVCEPHDLDVEIRAHYRDVWRRAERLAAYRPARRRGAEVA